MVHKSDFWLVDTSSDTAGQTTEKEDVNQSMSNSETSTLKAMQTFEQESILYQWGTKVAVRRFCRTCGILPFYIPRSNPDGYAVTLPCVDWGEGGQPEIEVKMFDGIHWEESHAATGIANET